MTEQENEVHLTINGKAVVVPKGTTVYEAAKKAGIEIPIFCYQDRMPPFGACRMCMVEVEKMPKPQTSCTLVANEGMVVHTESKSAKEAQEGILELLLINHPLDCPICDRGGECPLQDQTMKFGNGKSRFYEEKRHFEKALSLGPVLTLDRERCVLCARCTRFGDIIAGDHALEFKERGYRTEVGTAHGGPAESKFIGNTIQICPVGALTSSVYRFRARPWDNQSTETTCTLCPLGCNMMLDSRDGKIMRTRSKENKEVNDIWLCDKGWFGYEYTDHPERLLSPLVRKEGKLHPATWEEALSQIALHLKKAIPNGKIAGFGGNPLTCEDNYLFQKLLREGAKVNHIDHRIGMPIFSIEEEGLPPGMKITIGECEELSSIFLLGIDITEEFPVLWLRLKQAMNRGAHTIFSGHYTPEIASYFTQKFIHPPGQELAILQNQMAKALEKPCKKGAIFIGTQYLWHPQRKEILSALQKICHNHENLSLNIMEARGNSLGAREAGMHPSSGLNSLQVLEKAADSGWDYLHVIGANPAKKFPSWLWDQARKNLNFLVVQDLFLTETAECADVVLPALSFMEKEGTCINIEGRVQKIHPGKEIPNGLYTDIEIFQMIAELLRIDLTLDKNFSDFQKPKRKEIQKNETPKNSLEIPEEMVAATFAHALFDRGGRMKHNPHLIQLAREPRARLHPDEGLKRGIQDGDLIFLNHQGHSISAKVTFDKGVAEKTIVLPLGFSDLPVQELNTQLLNGLLLEISRIDS